MRNTITEENYLKAIFHLHYSEDKLSVNELSKVLNVKMPSVNNMMKKFAEKKWIIYESYKPLKVTQEGLKEAALVVRKHRLTEMFLVEKMNFGWENVHEIAEQLEHVDSPPFFDKMDELLNFPKVDPHGEPIPDKDGNIIDQDLIKLRSCHVGEVVIFESMITSDESFLNYLNDRNLKLGQPLEIVKLEEFDHTMHIKTEGEEITLSQRAIESILVKKIASK